MEVHQVVSLSVMFVTLVTSRELQHQQDSLFAKHSNLSSDSDLLLKLTDDKIYNRYLIPHFDTDTPINVKVDMYIKDFSSFSASDMQYTTNLIFRQTWTDERLQFTRLSDPRFKTLQDLDVHPKFLDRIWMPDPAFTNFKMGKVQDLLTPSKMLRIHRNGTVLLSAMISLTLSCRMMLEHYPLDTQICTIEFESFGYQDKNIRFIWRRENPIQFYTYGIKEHAEITQTGHSDEPLNFVMESAQFELLKYTLDHNCKRVYNTGKFSCLSVEFYFHRNIGYHLIQTFLPSCMIVMLSWVSFWFPPDATPSRTLIGVTSVLTMTTQTSGARKDLPAVSYVKAIDIWMIACLFYVFAAMLEFALVNYKHQQYLKSQKTKSRQGQVLQAEEPPGGGEENWKGDDEEKTAEDDELSVRVTLATGDTPTPSNFISESDIRRRQGKRGAEGMSLKASLRGIGEQWSTVKSRIPSKDVVAETIDWWAKVLFPLSFVLFIAIFWCVYKFKPEAHGATL